MKEMLKERRDFFAKRLYAIAGVGEGSPVSDDGVARAAAMCAKAGGRKAREASRLSWLYASASQALSLM